MRRIGTLSTRDEAQRFGAYLFGKGIQCEIEPGDGGEYLVWILDDDDLGRAQAELARYRENPHSGDFQAGAKKGLEELVEHERRQEKDKPQVVDARRAFSGGGAAGSVGGLTIALLTISITVYILRHLAAGDSSIPDPLQGMLISTGKAPGFLPEVMAGEVWRLLTPIFLHFGLMHIIFNMWWTKDLGFLIERVHGTLFFAVLVLGSALASNLAQYIVGGGNFGGMSGVVYAMFGFVWLRGRFDPGIPYRLDNFIVAIMIGWAVLCLTGALGPIANTAHFVGLGIGAAAGFLTAVQGRRGGR